MDEETKAYRIAQCKAVDDELKMYNRKIEILGGWGGTNYMDITEEEYRSISAILTGEADERLTPLIDACETLCNEIHNGRKLDIKKDFSLCVADSQARTAIHNAKGEL